MTTDELKDMEEKNRVSRFLNSTTIRTNPFGENVSGERAYRRAEKIAAGVYLVTNHITDTEPTKTFARSTALSLLSSVLDVRDDMRGHGSRSVNTVEGKVRKLISLMRLLSVSGRISTQNADVLVDALDELGAFLGSSQRTGLSESVSLSKEEFMLGTMARISDSRKKRHMVSIRHTPAIAGAAAAQKNASRTAEILGVLGSQGQVGIKDIVANLPEYSEKMIQRELKALVDGGRVKKIGAKRWSTYTLAQS